MELVRTAYGVGVDRGEAGVLEVRHVIGIGRNYAAHAHEQGADVPTRPMVFTKNPASARTRHDVTAATDFMYRFPFQCSVTGGCAKALRSCS